MKSARLSRTTAVLVLALVAPACRTPGREAPASPAAALFGEELRRIETGAPAAPMRLVLNESREGDALLRRPSRPVTVGDPALATLIARLEATVRTQEGVGIAAPQVGVNRRVILVQRLDREPEKPFVAYLNPEIVNRSLATVVDWEGCLSVPAGCAKVERSRSIVVAHDGPDGARATEKVEGFTARIFQHEIDHLDGVLFVDRKQPGELMPKEQYREMRRKQREREAPASRPSR